MCLRVWNLFFYRYAETDVVIRFPTTAKVYCQLGGGNRAPLHLCKRMLCVCVCVCEREREREIREREKERDKRREIETDKRDREIERQREMRGRERERGGLGG